MQYLKSKTTWLSVLLLAINALSFAQTLPLTQTQLEGVNAILAVLVFINRHYVKKFQG